MKVWIWLLWAAVLPASAVEPDVTRLPNPLPAISAPPLEMLAAVLDQLPAEVKVWPTEHYCYWTGTSNGKPMQGNLRFANGLRERGELSFSYTSGDESHSPHFTDKDGVSLTCEDAFTVKLTFREKSHRFHLHQLPQTPPAQGILLPDEQFVERTADESGLQFYLIYQRKARCFNWVLDESVAGNFTKLDDQLVLETRTEFVFHVSPQRKLLVGVKQSNVKANTAYDGPFDQLADNYAEQSGRRALLEQAVPECAGRIDAWGNYQDTPRPQRVGLVPYLIYPNLDEMKAFMKRAAAAPSLERFVSRQGK